MPLDTQGQSLLTLAGTTVFTTPWSGAINVKVVAEESDAPVQGVCVTISRMEEVTNDDGSIRCRNQTFQGIGAAQTPRGGRAGTAGPARRRRGTHRRDDTAE